MYEQYVVDLRQDEDNRNLTPVTMRKSLRKKTDVRTVQISYEHLEAAIASHLYTFGVVGPNEEIVSTDIDIPLDEDGLIELEITVEPVEKQLRLPLEDPLGR